MLLSGLCAVVSRQRGTTAEICSSQKLNGPARSQGFSQESVREKTFPAPMVGGLWTLFAVTGGKAPSFHGVSEGETAAPPQVENVGRGGTPPRISRRKDQPVRLGTEEKSPQVSHRTPQQSDLTQKLGFQSKTDVNSVQGALKIDLLKDQGNTI